MPVLGQALAEAAATAEHGQAAVTPWPWALGAAPGTALSRPLARGAGRQTAFLELNHAELRHGQALPEEAYSSAAFGGADQPPNFVAADLPAGTKSLAIVARDLDAPLPVEGEAEPLWAVAGISRTEVADLATAKTGTVVVPYHGPLPQDEFVHRVLFRLYAVRRRLPPSRLHSWRALEAWLEGARPRAAPGEASLPDVAPFTGDGGTPEAEDAAVAQAFARRALASEHADFLMTAVRRRPAATLL